MSSATDWSATLQAPPRRWLHRLSWVVLIAALAVLLSSLPVKAIAQFVRDWSEGSDLWATFLFAALFTLLTTFSLPVWPMPFLSGGLFGTWRGAAVASGSMVLAAAVTFSIARALRRTAFRERLERSPRMRALEKTVARGDWKIVAAIRVSHFLPFGMQNYGLGLTSMSLTTFLLTTWLVTLPGMILQNYVGHLGFTEMDGWSEQSGNGWAAWIPRAFGIAVFAAAILYLGHLARTVYGRELQAEMERAERDESGNASSSEAWRWTDALLPAGALLAAALAFWSYQNQEELADSVEQFAAQPASSQRPETIRSEA